MTRPGAAGFVLAMVLAGRAFAADEDYPPKDTVEASIYRGSIVFEKYCQRCHGPTGEGNGRAAKLYDPKPANLVMSDKNRMYKELIIRKGGEVMARSKFMPPWDNELTDEQIHDVVTFLGSINRNPNAPTD